MKTDFLTRLMALMWAFIAVMLIRVSLSDISVVLQILIIFGAAAAIVNAVGEMLAGSTKKVVDN